VRVWLFGERNVAKLERSKAEKLSVTNASSWCEGNKTYWVGAASGGMFFCRVRVSRCGGSVAILHNIVIGQLPSGGLQGCWTITHIM